MDNEFLNALISTLQIQRNATLDQLAQANATIVVLKKEIADMKTPESEQPDAA